MKTTAKIDLQVHDAQELIEKVGAAILKRYNDGFIQLCEDVEHGDVSVVVRGRIDEAFKIEDHGEFGTKKVVTDISLERASVMYFFHDHRCNSIDIYVDGKEVDLEQRINDYLEREVL